MEEKILFVPALQMIGQARNHFQDFHQIWALENQLSRAQQGIVSLCAEPLEQELFAGKIEAMEGIIACM